jgi:hypothetical protein
MERAMTALAKMPESDQQVANFVDRVCDEALDGWTDLEKFGERLLFYEKAIKQIKERLMGHIADEVVKNPDSRLKVVPYTSYDYKGDSKWQELAKAKKDHETFLKSLKEDKADVKTGEVHTPPIKKISESVQLKKKP